MEGQRRTPALDSTKDRRGMGGITCLGILLISWYLLPPFFGDIADLIVVGLILNEMMSTLWVQDYQAIVIACVETLTDYGLLKNCSVKEMNILLFIPCLCHLLFLSSLGGRPHGSLNWNFKHVVKMRLEEEYRLLTITQAIAPYQVLRLFVGTELIF